MQSATSLRMSRGAEQSVLTILFTDIEMSVAATQRLGDVRAQATFVRTHNAIVRQALREHAGAEVKHTGDGIMATFGSAAHAVACAVAIETASRAHNESDPHEGFRIRIGINAGEPVAEDADLFGTAVQLAARACAHADAGQVIVTDVVRQLVAGRGFRFDDRGEASLRGFADPVHLWEVTAHTPAMLDLPVVLPRWFRRVGRARLLAASAPIVLVGVATAVTAAVLIGASDGVGDNASAGRPAARPLAVHMASTTTITRVQGNCFDEDLVLTASVAGAVSGDIVGALLGETTARLHSAGGCREVSAVASGTITGTRPGDELLFTTHAVSSTRLVGIDIEGRASTSTSMRSALIVTGGRGAYEHAQGAGTCRILAQTTEESPDSARSLDKSEAECTLTISEGVASSPLIVQAVSGEDELTTLGGPADLPKAARIAVAYANNGLETIRGALLMLPEPEGARLAVSADSSSGADAAGVLGWRLPDLEPGATGTFYFTVQLLDADAGPLTLVPEVHAQGVEGPAQSEPITLAIVY